MTVGYELDEGSWIFESAWKKKIPPLPPSLPYRLLCLPNFICKAYENRFFRGRRSGRNANLIHHHLCLQPKLIKHGASYPLPQAWSEHCAEAQRQYDLIINMAQPSAPSN
jgi:hypothetical protein